MTRGKHIREIWEKVKTQNMKAFDVPTPEELIQKPLSDRGQHEKGDQEPV
jgi:hypothetical protein